MIVSMLLPQEDLFFPALSPSFSLISTLLIREARFLPCGKP